jgi:putative heme transporter
VAAAPGNLRLSNRSVVLAVAMLGATLLLLQLLAAADRVLGWMAVAAIGSALLHPLVRRVDRRLPRGAAIAVVFVGTMAAIGLVVFLGVDEVRDQADRLEEAAPDAAAELEQSDRFGEFAREFELRDRVIRFVDELPERLRGGTPTEALRSAATRSVAYLATLVLTLFLLIHGARLVAAGVAQISDPVRRRRVERLLEGSYSRATRYLAFTVARAAVAGVFMWAVAEIADVPGAVLLGLAAAVASLVPMIGVLIGSVPVLLLAAAFSPGRLALAAALVVLYQVGEVLLVQRRLEARSLHVGPVLSLVAAMAGLELYGVGGLFVAFVAVVFVAAAGKELAPREESDLLAAADAVLPGDTA